VAFAAGLHLGWIDRSEAGFRSFGLMKKFTGLVCMAVAVYLIGTWLNADSGIAWQPYSDELMQEAQKSNKPVIMDFSATWCPPCRKLKDVTFSDPEVVKQGRKFVALEVDLTRVDPHRQKLVKDFSIKGVPTVVFLDGQGRERTDLRLEGFVPPDEFSTKIEQLVGSGS
jgi:thiol:disulfide interchange protein DsbD